jgi:YidC/Oxa1 family membrane protein insertase
MNTVIPNFLYLSYPIINILVVIYQALLFLHIPSALGFSIIVLTVVIRLVLYPLTASQLKATKKMQDLNPHLKNLKEKHKNDAKMLQSETMKLYKEHGVNPAAGCLPLIIQLPLIFALYQVLNDVVKFNTNQINHVLYSFVPKLSRPWDLTFFGLPLAQSPSHLYQTLPIVLIIPLLTGVFQFIQSKMMLTAVPEGALVKKEEKKKEADFTTAFQSQSLYIFPFMIAFFSWGFPIGLSLYWNTFTIFGIIQQYKISGLGGLKEWTDKIYGSNK